MNKLFGENYDNESLFIDDTNTNLNTNNTNNDDNNNNNIKQQQQQNIKIEKEIIKEDDKNVRQNESSGGNDDKNKKNVQNEKSDINMNMNTDEKNNNTDCKEYPIRHIYNNNYFTLSATKNIFMFTPNKDSIIYKHRKIKTSGNSMNNPELKAVKEIYYKPKIPYIIKSNKKQLDNELHFSVKENYNNKLEDSNSEKENKNNKLKTNIKSINTYTRKYRKNNAINEILENKQIIKEDSNNIDDGGNSRMDAKKQYNKETFTKKITHEKNENIKIDNNDINNIINNNEKKGNNYAIYKNNTNKENENDGNINNNNNNENNKTESKDNEKNKKIKTTVKVDNHNENEIDLKDIKNFLINN
jgi:hypothetical protein